MTYLGIQNEAYRDCLEFLLLHQRPEGAFGFLGMEEHSFAVHNVEQIPAELALYLPVTVACLWTLAEANSATVRLYDSLAAMRSEAQSA